MNKYRTDIDGLRAIAVVSVILFHLGYLANGYLGVDIFFVISGYLITGIVYKEVENNKFSVLKFYERRLRRIFPLVIFTTSIAFILGLIFMLPDDLENLSQSVFASNFSVNNILMKITSADYWATRNDYKPLMHTWSLGIEEQFYILYPIIFFFLKGERKKYILPLLIILTFVSLFLFLKTDNVASKFYFLQNRFYQLSIGGISAVFFSKHEFQKKIKNSNYILVFLLVLLVILLYFNFIQSNDIKVLITTILTACILVLGGLHFDSDKLYKGLISNKLLVGIGKISFSLYMWHQIVFAFARYIYFEEISIPTSILLSIIVLILSIISYYLIENPFRNKNKIKLKSLLIIISVSFVLIVSSSLYVYMIGGIIKSVPELDINFKNRSSQLNLFSPNSNIHIQYNEDVRKLDKPFSNNTNVINDKKIKVLVLGNSFGRDIVNVLLESNYKNDIEISYSDLVHKTNDDLKQRIMVADYVFFGSDYPNSKFISEYKLDMNKVWIFGTKDFGNSNGIHYNRKIDDYSTYRSKMKKGFIEQNNTLRKEWGEKYIDLIGLIVDNKGDVYIYTPEGKFISQDCTHFTKHGAMYFAKLLDNKIGEIFNIKKIK